MIVRASGALGGKELVSSFNNRPHCNQHVRLLIESERSVPTARRLPERRSWSHSDREPYDSVAVLYFGLSHGTVSSQLSR